LKKKLIVRSAKRKMKILDTLETYVRRLLLSRLYIYHSQAESHTDWIILELRAFLRLIGRYCVRGLSLNLTEATSRNYESAFSDALSIRSYRKIELDGDRETLNNC
jgi:hypothetical protein